MAQPAGFHVEADAEFAKFDTNDYRTRWNPAAHTLPQCGCPESTSAASDMYSVAMLFLAELMAVLDTYHIKFDAACWSYCFTRLDNFRQTLFVSIGLQYLSAAKVLTLFKQHYLQQVRPTSEVARDRLHNSVIRMGDGPMALRTYETAFREQLRFCPDMSQADVIRFFRKGLTPELQVAT